MIYTVKQVAEKTGVSTHTLRFYEKEGVLLFVERDDNGNRIYSDESLAWLDFILSLRSTGMPLAGIKQYTELFLKGDQTIRERKQMMLRHKEKIEEQMTQSIRHLEKINYKLALYDVQENTLKFLP
jgi:DNA-binding transcriptional MerR regulator